MILRMLHFETHEGTLLKVVRVLQVVAGRFSHLNSILVDSFESHHFLESSFESHQLLPKAIMVDFNNKGQIRFVTHFVIVMVIILILPVAVLSVWTDRGAGIVVLPDSAARCASDRRRRFWTFD